MSVQEKRRGADPHKGRKLRWGKPGKAAQGASGSKDAQAGWGNGETSRVALERLEGGWNLAVRSQGLTARRGRRRGEVKSRQ